MVWDLHLLLSILERVGKFPSLCWTLKGIFPPFFHSKRPYIVLDRRHVVTPEEKSMRASDPSIGDGCQCKDSLGQEGECKCLEMKAFDAIVNDVKVL